MLNGAGWPLLVLIKRETQVELFSNSSCISLFIEDAYKGAHLRKSNWKVLEMELIPNVLGVTVNAWLQLETRSDDFNGLKLILKEILLTILEQFSLYGATRGLQAYLVPERRNAFCHSSPRYLPLSFLLAVCKLWWAETTVQQLHANPSPALLPGLIEIAEELSHIPEWQRWSSALTFWVRNVQWEFRKPFKKSGCLLGFALLSFSAQKSQLFFFWYLFWKSAAYSRRSCYCRKKQVDSWLLKGLILQLALVLC